MEVVSRGSLKLFKRPCELSAFFNAHPYIWSKNLGGPELSKSRLRLLHWGINSILLLSYCTFVIVRCVQVNMDCERSAIRKVYMVFISVFYVAGAMFQLCTISRFHVFGPFMSGYLTFVKNMRGNFTGIKDPKIRLRSKICEVLMTTIDFSFWVCLLFMSALNIVMPSSPEFISSLVSNCDDLDIKFRLLFALLHAYIMIIYLLSGLLWGHAMVLFMFSIVNMTSLLKLRLQKTNDVEVLANCVKTYRRLVLQNNSTVAKLLEPFYLGSHCLICIMAIFCAYGAVRQDELLAIAFAVFGFDIFVVFLTIVNSLAEVNVHSSALLQHIPVLIPHVIRNSLYFLGYGPLLGILRREWKSMPELRIQAGSAFYYDKSLVPTTAEIVLKNSINVLLLY